MDVRRLGVQDADALITLRRVALEHDPLSFGASLADDRACDPEFVFGFLRATRTNATFGAFSPELVGFVGIVRERAAKRRHKASVWGTFVREDRRGVGVGEALMRAAIACAAAWKGVNQLCLGVSASSEAAIRLYERLGFVRWGTEPNAMVHNGQSDDEHRMVLSLSPDATLPSRRDQVLEHDGGLLSIRAFEDRDEESVIALWADCGLLRPWNDPHKDIARKRRVQRDLFLVGTVDQKVVASVMAGYDGHRGWVNYLAVARAYQRQGFARSLMVHVEQGLQKLGCPKINLQIRHDNRAAIAFYRRLGFAEDAAASFGKRLERDDGYDVPMAKPR